MRLRAVPGYERMWLHVGADRPIALADKTYRASISRSWFP